MHLNSHSYHGPCQEKPRSKTSCAQDIQLQDLQFYLLSEMTMMMMMVVVMVMGGERKIKEFLIVISAWK